MDPASYLRIYNIPELERIAHKQLKTLANGFAIPVDVEHIVEELPSVDLDYYPCLRSNYGLDGMIGRDPDTNEIIIYIDEELATSERLLRRYRMTIAEELAHLILHRKAIESVENPDDFLFLHKLPEWYKYERNAKKLAAMILMPSECVLEHSRNLYREIISHVGFDNPEVVKNFLASKLADRYEVSLQTMKIRLEEWPVNVMDKINRAMQDKLDFLD